MNLGAHISIAGGFCKAAERAEVLGCTAMQIFSRNPRGWRFKDISQDDLDRFKDILKEKGISPLVVHVPYLTNLASPREDLYEKSVDSIISDIKLSDRMGADYFVTHMGSHRGKGIAYGISRLSSAIRRVLKAAKPRLTLLVENGAGTGDTLGKDFDQMAALFRRLPLSSGVGVCLDTAHLFAAGYDIRTPERVKEVMEEFDLKIGIDRIKLIHLNDSKSDMGSMKDRHWHIGKGKIGREGIRSIVGFPGFRKIPFILETPVHKDGDDRRNLNVVRRLSTR